MMTVYVTKASNNNFMISEMKEMDEYNSRKRLNPDQNIYNYRVNKEYRKMFNEPSAWLGYQYFDPENEEFTHPKIR
jgi:hypothetical protein